MPAPQILSDPLSESIDAIRGRDTASEIVKNTTKCRLAPSTLVDGDSESTYK